MDLITGPWPWYIGGPMIALVLFLLLWFGETFGLSSNLRTMCSMIGAGRFAEFFRFDWKQHSWNLIFVLGTITGGYIASHYMNNGEGIALSENIVKELEAQGLENPGATFLPESIFNFESLLTWKGFIMMIVGGFFVGFGTRYANGCTSGHAITGLSNMQLPSLIATIGFFIGGLITTFFVLPYVLAL